MSELSSLGQIHDGTQPFFTGTASIATPRKKQNWLKDVFLKPIDDEVLDGQTARIFFMQTIEGNTDDRFVRTPQSFEIKLTPEVIRTLISLRNQKARKGFKIVYSKSSVAVPNSSETLVFLYCICMRTPLLREAYEALFPLK